MPSTGTPSPSTAGSAAGASASYTDDGPARKNDAERLQCLNFLEGRRAGQHDGEDVQLAYAPRNQLRILRTKIENYDCLGVHSLVWQGQGGDVKIGKPGQNLATQVLPPLMLYMHERPGRSRDLSSLTHI